jgi:hypothetical protein
LRRHSAPQRAFKDAYDSDQQNFDVKEQLQLWDVLAATVKGGVACSSSWCFPAKALGIPSVCRSSVAPKRFGDFGRCA